MKPCECSCHVVCDEPPSHDPAAVEGILLAALAWIGDVRRDPSHDPVSPFTGLDRLAQASNCVAEALASLFPGRHDHPTPTPTQEARST